MYHKSISAHAADCPSNRIPDAKKRGSARIDAGMPGGTLIWTEFSEKQSISTNALSAINLSLPMGTPIGSIAPMSAM